MQISTRRQLKQLNDLYKEGNELYYKVSAEMGLSGSALMILYGLSHIGHPCTQKELCDAWYMKKQTLHSALNNLIQSQDVFMEPLPGNSRIKLIVLTEKGKALCEKTAVPFINAELRAFERLSAQEREMLLSLTQKHTIFIKEESERLLKTFKERKDKATKKENEMLIRQETPNDYEEVYSVVKNAFKTAEHSDGNEQDLVTALRSSNAFIPELSLVALIEGKIAGHIMFTEAKVGKETVLVLAPLSVSPDYQKQGVGTALIQEAHKIAKELGYTYSLVLGSEKYYPRSGYISAEQFGIEVPEGIPSANFMAIQLQENAHPVRGGVKYAKEFGI